MAEILERLAALENRGPSDADSDAAYQRGYEDGLKQGDEFVAKYFAAIQERDTLQQKYNDLRRQMNQRRTFSGDL
jgi:hypothetical protein